jgi:enterochelin esterase family protein
VAVQVAGTRLAMTKSDQGVWSVTSGPLEPDLYAYSFDVDGVTIPDPGSRQYQTSFNSFQSLLVIPGPAMWLPHAGRRARRYRKTRLSLCRCGRRS